MTSYYSLKQQQQTKLIKVYDKFDKLIPFELCRKFNDESDKIKINLREALSFCTSLKFIEKCQVDKTEIPQKSHS